MISGLITTARFGYAAVSGVDALVDRLGQYAVKLALRSHQVDSNAGAEMVELMRSRVPQDTGRLFNGITFETDDEGTVVTASAVHEGKSGVDYAGFVERGTRAGVRRRSIGYAADENYFNLTLPTKRVGATYARSRRQYRTHLGTEAQPFFFDSAEEVLERRGESLDEAITTTANETELA